MPPQQRPLIRVGNRMVPGPPVVNANLRSLLDPNADITIAPETFQANVSALQPAVAQEPVPLPKILDLVSQLFAVEQTPESPTPPDGVLGWLRSLWEKSGEGPEGLAELAAGVAKHKLDRDIQIIQSVADATKRGVKWSGEFLSGLKEDVQGLTPESALSATDAFGSMFTGRERTVPAQNNRLDQASAAAGVILSLMDPSPAGELKAARGLYSRVDDLVKLIPAKGAHPNRVLSVLKSGSSGEELAYRGVPEFLAQQGNTPVTPAMLAEHLKANPAPMPKAKVLGKSESHFTLHSKHGIRRGIFPTEADAKAAMTEAGEYTLPAWSPDPPKYATYQVPGGENYRETLLTLPETREQFKVVKHPSIKDKWAIQNPDGSLQMNGAEAAYWSHKNVAESIAGGEGYAKRGNFTSTHYPDDPNIVVHVRSNQRTLPKLGRGEFLEEVQSDWHQKGKKEGYGSSGWTAKPSGVGTPLTPGGWWNVYNQNGERVGTVTRTGADTPEQAIATVAGRSSEFKKGVPDAPFKDSWPDLALKQKLLEVADDPDAQWIGWTSGKTQAARYDLSKHISEVHYSGTNLVAYDLNGKKVIEQTGITRDKLPDFIGKEAAERLLAKEPQGTLRSLVGLDLKVGGEGMVEFYDKQLVAKMNRLVKPFGGVATPVRVGREPAWIVKLTPEMKAKIREIGFPLMTGLAATGASMAHESIRGGKEKDQ